MRHAPCLALLGAIASLAPAGCGNPLSTSDSITYNATGTAATVALTYTGQSQSNEQVSLPWSKTVSIRKGSSITITARIVSESGCVTVEIVRSGSSRKSPEICGTQGQLVSVSTTN